LTQTPATATERRRLPRCILQERVTVRFWKHGVCEQPGIVENASPDGMFLETPAEVPLDAPVEVVFHFPATLRSPGVRFTCRCRVVRSLRAGRNTGLALAIVRTESERLAHAHRRESAPYPGYVMAD
jgi:hypothetical protein